MQISAHVRNTPAIHEAKVSTGGNSRSLEVAGKLDARGSAVNGGEFLMLALATCYCNDLFREAERLGIPLDEVEVEARAEFPGVGLAATNIRYNAKIISAASDSDISRLLRETDRVAEVHNTIRAGVAVELEHTAAH